MTAVTNVVTIEAAETVEAIGAVVVATSGSGAGVRDRATDHGNGALERASGDKDRVLLRAAPPAIESDDTRPSSDIESLTTMATTIHSLCWALLSEKMGPESHGKIILLDRI